MKKIHIVAIGAACFVGVLGALQVNRFLEHRAESQPIVFKEVPAGKPVQYTSEAVPVDFRGAAKKVLQSVVTVDRFDRVSRFFADDVGSVQKTGGGSGVIISADGIIVTNNHVVQNAAEVAVKLPDNKTLRAKVLGTSPRFDLAVLKVQASNLTPVEMGSSKGLEVGQWVLAVGNPLGFDQTVSVGVISSLGRSLGVEQNFLTDAIQTDAAINPGNSGGALTNANGQLIGINSAIASNSGGSIGIGFAIPVDRVRDIASQIVSKGYASTAGLGIRFNAQYVGILKFEQARAQLTQMLGATPPDYGIIVGEVVPGDAAAKAGMKPYDILLSIDGQKVDTPLVLNQVLNRKKPGDEVQVTYWSKGETKKASVPLSEVPDK